ncbi:MAG: aspartate aminotransferase family protein [Rhodospirillaceae bacterium]|nr:MAG: aspartate aminotransferase family protein [Rhodospirillaceae bacterium]
MTDPSKNKTFAASNALLKQALATIPTGSQTFSKSHIQFPDGHAPLFVDRAQGAHFTDIDGNVFVDLAMGLAAIGLGYCDPDVDAAIREQLACGISFSLPTRLEAELAELIVDVVPSAEMVRFAKNGSDVTSAAVRLARAYTGRERVLACGYHGWHDWYIGTTTRDLGVPGSVRVLTDRASANDPETVATKLAEHPDGFAAIIVEPMLLDNPKAALSEIRALANRSGAVLIFDEVVTGFRFALGGAQQLYGVTPDLTCLGKSMANGMPLSAVTGRRDIMRLMEDIFFSGTFGGEALSLAASLATIRKIRKQGVVEHLWAMGGRLQTRLRQTIAKYGLGDLLSVMNEPCLGFIAVSEGRGNSQAVNRTFMLAEMIRHGVFMNGSLTICHAFGEEDLQKVAEAFDSFAERFSRELEIPGLEARLPYPPITPIFTVRAPNAEKEG